MIFTIQFIHADMSNFLLHGIDANPVKGKHSNDKNIVAHWEAFFIPQIKPGDKRYEHVNYD